MTSAQRGPIVVDTNVFGAGLTSRSVPLAQPEHSADLWIATTAVHLDLPLVTDDGIFAEVPGLRLEMVPSG